jgi:hypothetical protein
VTGSDSDFSELTDEPKQYNKKSIVSLPSSKLDGRSEQKLFAVFEKNRTFAEQLRFGSNHNQRERSEPDHETEGHAGSELEPPGRMSENFRGRSRNNRKEQTDDGLEIVGSFRDLDSKNENEESPQFPKRKYKEADAAVIFNLVEPALEKKESVEDEVLQQFTFKDQQSAAAAFANFRDEKGRANEFIPIYQEYAGMKSTEHDQQHSNFKSKQSGTTCLTKEPRLPRNPGLSRALCSGRRRRFTAKETR